MNNNMNDIHGHLFKAIEQYPYFARGFAAMTLIEKTVLINGRPTFGVDKYWRLYWSKEALDNFKYGVTAVLRHELEHLLREHSDRIGSRFARQWNWAADLEINDDIKDIGVVEGVLLPVDFDFKSGKAAEYYYNKLSDLAKDDKSGGGKGGKGGEGSGVTGKAEPWEEPPPPGAGGEEDAPAGISPEEVEELLDAIASDVECASSKDPGSVPGGIKLWAAARAKGKLPKISWKKEISNRLRRIIHGSQDYSFTKQSRRQDRGDRCLLPGRIAYEPGLGVVIDTSGSMSDKADWIAGVLKSLSRMSCKVTIIDCDAAVHGTRTLRHWRDVLKSRGGGGTDMRVGIDYALNNKNIDLTLVLTDGYTPWPALWPKAVIGVVCGEDDKVSLFKGDS